MNEGFITYLGVHENYRRKGYATRLLETALNWFFLDMGKVSLTVHEKNDNALALYEKTGFILRYAGVNMRLE